MVTAQIMNKKFASQVEKAITYYSILFCVGHIHLTTKEIQLLAFTAIKGTLSKGGAKEQFIEMFPTARVGISNLTLSLIKKNIFTRNGRRGKVRVNPSLLIDFKTDISLRINLSDEE